MRYSADWHDDASNAAAEERATVADLRLWLNNQNVAMHLLGVENVDHLTIALYGLAEGIVHDWWTLFGGRDREISLIQHRGGYAVPDVRMRYDGAAFEITAHQCVYRNPEARFWAGPTEVMNRPEAEAQLGGFVELILERLARRDQGGTSAALRWARVQASMADADEAAFCEAAGALGLDPYEISDEATEAIEHAGKLFEGEPLTEFLAGAGRANQQSLLRWVETVERRPRYTSRVADLKPIALEAAQDTRTDLAEASWALGYRRARAMRRVLNLDIGRRFRSSKAMAEFLGASKSYAPAGAVDGLRALRSDHPDGVRIYLRSHGKSAMAVATNLFSFVRAVGDVACFPDDARAPVNALRDAYRQAAGRAFAAEFLAPIDEVRSMYDDGRDTLSIAEEFGVSPTVIDRQLENQDRIEEACA